MNTSYLTERQATIDFLTEIGLLAIPVAPKQCAEKHPIWIKDEEGNWQVKKDQDGNKIPKYSGKNPSFLDAQGKPQIIKHKEFHTSRKPTQAEHDAWFVHSDNGVATFGGWNSIVILDFDAKQFKDKAECDRRFYAWLDEHPALKESWIEKTTSGGFHLAVKVKKQPEKPFKLFSLDGIGGDHVGEVLGVGSFCVLAPSIGANGKAYKCLNRAKPVEVESLEEIGIYSVTKEETIKLPHWIEANTAPTEPKAFSAIVDVKKLLCVAAKQILGGEDTKGDKSESLATLGQEVSGWQNFLGAIGIGIEQSFDSLMLEAANALGVKADRVPRILSTERKAQAKPALWFKGGDSLCWSRIGFYFKEIYSKFCPNQQKVKEEIKQINQRRVRDFRKLKESKKQRNRYLDLTEIEKALKEGGYLIFVKSFMGSGKSYGLLKVLANLYKQQQQGFCWMAHRIKLIKQARNDAQKRFNLPACLLNEVDIPKSEFSLLHDLTQSFFFCGESLSKVEQHIEGRNWIIDEICGVISQLNSGGTVKGTKQARTLKALENAAQKCLNLIVMDANLSEDEIKLLAETSGKKVLVIENEEAPEPADIIFLTIEKSDSGGNSTGEELANDLSAISKRILEAKCPFIMSDSAKYLLASLEPELAKNKTGFTLCQKTAEETWLELNERIKGALVYFKPSDPTAKWADELMTDPDDFITRYKPQYLAMSPTGESGLSITLRGYFTSKYLASRGVLDINNLSQMPFRLRDNSIKTYVSMPEVAQHKDDRDYYLGCEELSAFDRQERHNLVTQAWAENDAEAGQRAKVTSLAFSRLSQVWEDYGRSQAYRNQIERSFYAESLQQLFTDMGHNVTVEKDVEAAQVAKQLKENKEEFLESEALAEFNAREVAYEEANKAFQNNPTSENTRIKNRAAFLHFLPGIDEDPVWSKDFIKMTYENRDWRTMHDNFFLLSHPEIMKAWANSKAFKQLTTEFVSQHSLGNKKVEIVTGLNKLGILNLLDKLVAGEEVSKDHPDLIELVKKGRSKSIKLLLGFAPSKDTTDKKERMDYLKRVLNVIGLDVAANGQRLNEKGVKTRYYKLNNDLYASDARRAILEGLERFYQRWQQEQVEKGAKIDWALAISNEGIVDENYETELTKLAETKIEFTDETFGLIKYQMPSLEILKIAQNYLQYLKRKIETPKGFATEVAALAALFLSDLENFPAIGEAALPILMPT